MRSRSLDEIDRSIVTHLAEDGRRSYTLIGKSVGLSEASVRQRVARMIRDQVIRVTAVPNPTELGYVSAGVGLKVRHGTLGEHAARLAEFPQTDFVAIALGSCDLNIGVVCKGPQELLEFLTGTLRSIEGLEVAEFHIHVRTVKNEFCW